jgi:ParB-like chromosome segregation protein Spo0J
MTGIEKYQVACAEGLRRLPISDIKIGKRCRTSEINIESLADSIRERGLIHAVVVDEDFRLIAGFRRLKALGLLGQAEVPVHVAARIKQAVNLMMMERDENVCREPFLPTEMVEVGRRVEALEKPKAEAKRKAGKSSDGKAGGRGKKKEGENPGATCAKVTSDSQSKEEKSDANRTSALAAKSVGAGTRTYEKAREVVAAAAENPERFGDLPGMMDETGKIDGAFNELKKRRREDELTAALASNKSTEKLWTLTAAQDVVQCDAIITDPPYGILTQDWEPTDLEKFTREWMTR